MHGGFKTATPVKAEPLPLTVRHEIHEVIRQGYTVVCVERRGTGWRVRFSGPRSMSSIISIDVGREASVA